MPKFVTEMSCRSCDFEASHILDVENTSGPEDDDANAENAPECEGCGDVNWTIVGYEDYREVRDASGE